MTDILVLFEEHFKKKTISHIMDVAKAFYFLVSSIMKK